MLSCRACAADNRRRCPAALPASGPPIVAIVRAAAVAMHAKFIYQLLGRQLCIYGRLHLRQAALPASGLSTVAAVMRHVKKPRGQRVGRLWVVRIHLSACIVVSWGAVVSLACHEGVGRARRNLSCMLWLCVLVRVPLCGRM